MRTMPALIGTMALAGISVCVAVSPAQQQPGTAPVQAPVQAQPPAAVPAQPAAVPAQPAAPAATASAFTLLNKDSVKTDSTHRIIGGQIAPDILNVVMVRKPPQPAGAASPAPAAPASARGAAAGEAPK